MKINTFSLSHISIIILTILFIIAVYFILRNKSANTKRWVLFSVSLYSLITFPFLSLECIKLGSNWQNELPLHICGIARIIMPIAFLINRRSIYNFCYLIFMPCAFLGILSPFDLIVGHDFYELASVWYFTQHMALLIVGINIALLKIAKPKIVDAIFSMIIFFVIVLIVFSINELFINCNNTYTNYIFTMGPGDNSILKLFWKICPVPFVYLLFLLPILCVVEMLLLLPYFIINKNQNIKNIINY